METMTAVEVDLMAVEGEADTAVMWTATATATVAVVAEAAKPALAGMKKSPAVEVATEIHDIAAEMIVDKAQYRRTTGMVK